MLKNIIESVLLKCGKDLSVHSPSFLKKVIMQRLHETSSDTMEGYLEVLEKDNDELAVLINSLYITYSLFFRNQTDVSLLEGFILPEMMQLKRKDNGRSVRIWSAGCADGPEAYSLTMLAEKVISDRDYRIQVMVFGTDISAVAIENARAGSYDRSAVQNAKLSYVDRYFTLKNSKFSVNDEIRSLVDFSQGDLIGPAFVSPSAGIFADFDLVSCCNLMIYYNQEVQQLILEKLYHSLCKNGYLMVGESEQLIVEKFGKFRLFSSYGNIFVKK